MLTEALVVHKKGGDFVLQEVELEDVRDDEVLVEMVATGVCHTDLVVRDEDVPGQFPAVFGHEGSGKIVKVGAKVTDVAVGDHVITTYTCCRSCDNCRKRVTSYCDTMTDANFGPGRLDGSKAFKDAKTGEQITSHFFGQSSFARKAVVSAASVIKVNPAADLSKLAPLACGVMTGAGAMLNVLSPEEGSTIVVTGAGAVGLSALMALGIHKAKPSKVIAVDVVPARLDLAKKYGATDVINAKDQPDLEAALKSLTGGRGINGAIDTTGRPATLKALLNSCARQGKVVTVGVGKFSDEVSINIFDTINSGRTYVGCCMGNCYPQEFIPKLVEENMAGNFPFTDLIQKFPATKVDEAIKEMLNGNAVKVVLEWS